MIDSAFFFAMYAFPVALIVFATRRAIRKINAAYDLAVEASA